MKRQFIQLVKPIVSRFPRWAMIYRYIRDTWHLYDEPQQTPMGFKLIGNLSMQKGEYETEETEIAKKIISKVDVFINIGANIGYYCCIALNHGKQVVAIEPMDHNLRYLLRNIKVNNYTSPIEVYPLALSNSVGVIEMFGGGPQASLVKGWGKRSGQYATLVPSSTLDNVLHTRFQGKNCFILVDIEGAELMMLEGATSFVNGYPKPIWMIEISISEHQPEGLCINPNLVSTFQVFWNRGYEAWTADKQCQIILPDEIEGIAKGGVDTFSTHNFLFIEKGKKNELLDI
ncbi:MAG: FkbM family methyltransferase [Anaerolineae bacterium]|nr:FkbM family methyltransferase [Anaerolineae bacterium]